MPQLRSLTLTELQSAYQKGVLTLGNWQQDDSLWQRYSTVPFCKDLHDAKYCLYLFLYALDSWKDDCENYLTEDQLITIVTRVEQLQQAMCDCTIVPEPVLAPTMPVVHNGTYTQNDPTNPVDISSLAMATTGKLRWYVSNTPQDTPPALPSTPGIYTNYQVSQFNTTGESTKLSIKITILPQQVLTAGYKACPIDADTPIAIDFTNVDDGSTVAIYKNGTYYGTTLSIDPSVAQNDSYSVIQTISSLTSVPTLFRVQVFTVPILGAISGPVSPTAGAGAPVMVYQITMVDGISSYLWTLPDDSTSPGVSANGINQVSFQFLTTGSKTISVIGNTSDGCTAGPAVKTLTAQPLLDHAYFTGTTNSEITGRIYTATVNVHTNPTDTLTYSMDVIDDPLSSTITPVSGTIVSSTHDGSFNIQIDASSTFGAGTVTIRFTLTNSSMGAILGDPIYTDVLVTFSSSAHCTEGYTLSDDQTICTKEDTILPVVTHTNYCLVGSQNMAYTQNGTRIYNQNFTATDFSNFAIPSQDLYALMVNAPQWNSSSSTNGPMNRAGVWIDSNCDGTRDPLSNGTQTTIATVYNNTGMQRIVYVGIGGDNQFILTVNNTVIAQTTIPASHANYGFWHIIPVVLVPGVNYFNATGTGDGSTSDSIGMVIYDNTPLEIKNATDDSQLNILWTSGSLIGQHVDIATCVAGYNLDTSGGPGNYICRRTETTAPIIG